ncbi:MAG: hypothetical protein LBP51_06070 [Deferribacteraceae bacterium]|nr:hypothetical protein [Deferribacteraceae bacterium]
MERFLFHKALPAFLFALSALFFTACSSSGGSNGGDGGSNNKPVDRNGFVVIPAKYASGCTVYVCSDENNNSSCDDGEPKVQADDADGSFSIPAYEKYPYIAEFYADDTGTSGVSIMASGSKPVLIYTSPAGKDAISAFTTMVKNVIDLHPLQYTVDTASAAVKQEAGIPATGDLFNKDAYTGGIATVHDTASEVAEGVLKYIADTFPTVVFTPAQVAALYTVVFNLVSDIAADSTKTAEDFVDEVESGSDVEAAINDATAALNAVEDWNISEEGITFYSLYSGIGFGANYGGIEYQVVKTGSILQRWKSEHTMPVITDPPYETSYVEYNLTQRSIAIVSDGASTLSTRFFGGHGFTLPAGSKVYIIYYDEDYTKSIDSIAYLRNYFDQIDDGLNEFGGEWIDYTYNLIANGDEVSYKANVADADVKAYYQNIVFNTSSLTFTWTRYDHAIFNDDSGTFHKNGSYAKTGIGEDEVYTFTAEDGSKAFIFHPKTNDRSRWCIATYPLMNDRRMIHTDEVGVNSVIDQLVPSIVSFL